MTLVLRCLFGLALLAALTPAVAAAQTEPSPQTFFGATLDLATALGERGAPEINQQIRGESPFDNVQLRVFADVVVSRRFTVFNQILINPSTQRLELASFLRSYLRYEAFRRAKSDMQVEAGKIPTVFGAFSPRAHSNRAPLVSVPLMYHYFSSLRSNQLPADNADLLRHRGEGAIARFRGFAGGGSTLLQSGLPMVYDPCWDVGVAVVGSLGRLEYRAAVTQGTVSSPRFKGGDNNEGKQGALRVAFVPLIGLLVGASYARGPYLDSAVTGALPAGAKVEDFDQEIYGFDLDFSVRHFQLIAEFAVNRWESPKITDGRGGPADLHTRGGYIEAKYALRPGLFLAARYDRLAFGEIDDGTQTGTATPWDYGIRQWEWGVGYHLTDRVIGKLVRLDYRRPGSSSPDFWALQVSTAF